MRHNPTARTSHRQTLCRAVLTVIATVVFLTVLFPGSAYAASGDINTVLDSIRNWLAGLLAALATLFLTIGGVRYVIAAGNPRMMDEGKAAMLVDILRRVIGAA